MGRQYSMQRFLNSWSVLCTAIEVHFGKGTKGDTALPTLPNPYYPSKIANTLALLCTITLASLVKGEVLSPKKFGRLPEGLPHHPLPLHQPSPNRTIPRKSPTPLPPLSKGGGLTAKHKLLLCCVLIAISTPFLSPNLSAVKTEGLLAPFASHHILTAPYQR